MLELGTYSIEKDAINRHFEILPSDDPNDNSDFLVRGVRDRRVSVGTLPVDGADPDGIYSLVGNAAGFEAGTTIC